MDRPFSHQKEFENITKRLNEIEEQLENSINEDLKLGHEVNFLEILGKKQEIEFDEHVTPELG